LFCLSVGVFLFFDFLIYLFVWFLEAVSLWALWLCTFPQSERRIVEHQSRENGRWCNHVQYCFRLRTGHWKPSYLSWPWPASIVFFYDWVST
jgi:hypothetical protein